MFLIIHEDGNLELLRVLADGDKSASDDGYCTIVDIGLCEDPKEYHQNNWHDIE